MGSLPETLAFIFIVFLSIGLHEYAHCKVAELMGDPTPREMGRVTLNLFKHFDLTGSIMIIVTSIAGFGIGWGKPAPANPNKMRNPRWGFFASVIAGPLCNIAQAVVWALLLQVSIVAFRFLNVGGDPLNNGFRPVAMFCMLGILLNLRLALFNLIPLGPLDGHWLVGLLMPKKAMNNWFQFNRQFGGYLLLALIIISQVNGQAGRPSYLSLILGPPVDFLFGVLTGFK